MDKTYDPHAIERRWYQTWEERGWFAPARQGTGSFCIMIPPPNVTGSLHMGHGFNNTIMDTLVRYHRMKGDRTLWQPGTDHAGIATQMVVERRLEAEGKTRHDLGREEFIRRIWEWKAESGGHITRQLRRLGSSLDWEHERFTMDEGLSAAVGEVFVRLYEEGLIYRGKRLVNWDPKLHTAVSDLEVLSAEEDGHMWHMRYPLSNGQGHLVVSTTRPETMLGDCAVAVNPEDPRYRHLIGEQVELPLTGRRIPIIADDHADPEFGTGCVKITPAHDFNDYQVWLGHRDETAISDQPHGGLINIFTTDAAVRANEPDEDDLIPPAYGGLDRYAARRAIVADLEAAGLLEKVVDHKLMVPRGDRSGAVIEPLLTDQWYVRAGPLAGPAMAAVESGAIRFVPDNWKNTYFEWMRNIQDWCISRQIWWGHRIPAWYDGEGNIYVGRSEEEVRARHDLPADYPLEQDPDVLDTWFSSALWPFSTLGWPADTERLDTFYPTSVLVTGFDIIFFWVARMIMMGLKFMDDVPFREVYVHGLVRDAHGHKMSKSKGNVLDPIDLIDGIGLEDLVAKRTRGLMQPRDAAKIEQQTRKDFPAGIPGYGTDALRFTFAALASTGRDIKLDAGRIEGYRNFCNKLWNAARYVLMNVEGEDCGLSPPQSPPQGGGEAGLSPPQSPPQGGEEAGLSPPQSPPQGGGEGGLSSPQSPTQGGGEGGLSSPQSPTQGEEEAGLSSPQSPTQGEEEAGLSSPQSPTQGEEEAGLSPPQSPPQGGRETGLSSSPPQSGGDRGGERDLELSASDRWITSRFHHTVARVTAAIAGYRFDHAAQAIYEFTWNEYCDWYLELSKPVLTDAHAAAAAQRGTRRTLVSVLEALLRLIHPVMPFITEEIWQRAAPAAGVSGDTIMTQPWPLAGDFPLDAEAEAEMEWAMDFIRAVRNIKGEMNISPGRPVPVLLANASDKDRDRARRHRPYLDFLARTASVDVLETGDEGPESATALVGAMKVLIPLADLIDKDAELARLQKEMGRLSKDLEKSAAKLANPSFVDRAPAAVVDKERARVGDMQAALDNLEGQAAKIRAL